jgi:hypothetical protein
VLFSRFGIFDQLTYIYIFTNIKSISFRRKTINRTTEETLENIFFFIRPAIVYIQPITMKNIVVRFFLVLAFMLLIMHEIDAIKFIDHSQ